MTCNPINQLGACIFLNCEVNKSSYQVIKKTKFYSLIDMLLYKLCSFLSLHKTKTTISYFDWKNNCRTNAFQIFFIQIIIVVFQMTGERL